MKTKMGYVCFRILLITIRDVLGYVDLAVSTQDTEKGGAVTITATTNESAVTWEFKGSHLSTCTLLGSMCFPSQVNNMMVTANSGAGTSTLQIDALNCSVNNGRLIATAPSLETKETTIVVYTPASNITWKTNVPSYPVDSATLLVEILCVYPVEDIEVNFTVMIEGQSDIIVPAESVSLSSGSYCECSERTLEVKKTITFPNKVVRVKANVFHKSLPNRVPKVELFPGNITFSSGPTTALVLQTTTQLPTASTSSDNKYYVISACGGVVLLLLSVIGLCCFYRRNKSNSEHKLSFEVHSLPSKSTLFDDNGKTPFNNGTT